MAENVPNQKIVQKSHGVPNKINQNKPKLRYSIIKTAGVRNKENFERQQEKSQNHMKGNPVRLSAKFCIDTKGCSNYQQMTPPLWQKVKKN